jgi:phosphatidate cytidylyltransferase
VTRVASGLALLAGLVVIVWFLPPLATLALALLFAALGAREYFALARECGTAPLGRAGREARPPAAGEAALEGAARPATPEPREGGPAREAARADEWTMSIAVCAVCAAAGLGARLETTLLAALVLAGALVVATGRPDQDVVRRAAVLLLPVLYVGLPLGVLVLMRSEFGPGAVFAAVLTVIASDTGQFYGGKAFGRRKLAPVLSPKKTVEGAVSGFVAAAAALPVLGWFWLPAWPAWVLAVTGATLAAAGIVGDLFESLIKRSADVKDSSALIPGHGGVLDRIDALLFAGPLLYVLLRHGGAIAPLPGP